MNDYDLSMLFTEYYGLMESHYINYISVLFAFLAASFFAASKLHTVLVIIVISLFSIFSFDSILVLYYLNLDIVEIQSMMHERVLSGSVDLMWHGGARADFDPEYDTSLFVYSRIIVSIVGYFSGLIFFFFCRKKTKISNE